VTLPRGLLLLLGVVFVPFGVWGIVHPVAATALTDVQLPTATALADGRAIYGGVTLGLGAFFLLAAAMPSMARAGLWVAFLTLGGAGSARALGVVLDGAGGPIIYPTLAFELGLAALSALTLIRSTRP
jgi:Domain of unknown function (DUF4345)